MNWNDVGVQAITALTPVAVMVLLWAAKNAWSKVPAAIVVFAAPVLGILFNWAISYIAGHPPAAPLAAAGLGALAVFLREFVSTVLTKGVSGPITPTKNNF